MARISVLASCSLGINGNRSDRPKESVIKREIKKKPLQDWWPTPRNKLLIKGLTADEILNCYFRNNKSLTFNIQLDETGDSDVIKCNCKPNSSIYLSTPQLPKKSVIATTKYTAEHGDDTPGDSKDSNYDVKNFDKKSNSVTEVKFDSFNEESSVTNPDKEVFVIRPNTCETFNTKTSTSSFSSSKYSFDTLLESVLKTSSKDFLSLCNYDDHDSQVHNVTEDAVVDYENDSIDPNNDAVNPVDKMVHGKIQWKKQERSMNPRSSSSTCSVTTIMMLKNESRFVSGENEGKIDKTKPYKTLQARNIKSSNTDVWTRTKDCERLKRVVSLQCSLTAKSVPDRGCFRCPKNGNVQHTGNSLSNIAKQNVEIDNQNNVAEVSKNCESVSNSEENYGCDMSPGDSASRDSIKTLELFLNMVTKSQKDLTKDELGPGKCSYIYGCDTENDLETSEALSDSSCVYESCEDTCNGDYEDALPGLKNAFTLIKPSVSSDNIHKSNANDTFQGLLKSEIQKCNEILSLYTSCITKNDKDLAEPKMEDFTKRNVPLYQKTLSEKTSAEDFWMMQCRYGSTELYDKDFSKLAGFPENDITIDYLCERKFEYLKTLSYNCSHNTTFDSNILPIYHNDAVCATVSVISCHSNSSSECMTDINKYTKFGSITYNASMNNNIKSNATNVKKEDGSIINANPYILNTPRISKVGNSSSSSNISSSENISSIGTKNIVNSDEDNDVSSSSSEIAINYGTSASSNSCFLEVEETFSQKTEVQKDPNHETQKRDTLSFRCNKSFDYRLQYSLGRIQSVKQKSASKQQYTPSKRPTSRRRRSLFNQNFRISKKTSSGTDRKELFMNRGYRVKMNKGSNSSPEDNRSQNSTEYETSLENVSNLQQPYNSSREISRLHGQTHVEMNDSKNTSVQKKPLKKGILKKCSGSVKSGAYKPYIFEKQKIVLDPDTTGDTSSEQCVQFNRTKKKSVKLIIPKEHKKKALSKLDRHYQLANNKSTFKGNSVTDQLFQLIDNSNKCSEELKSMRHLETVRYSFIPYTQNTAKYIPDQFASLCKQECSKIFRHTQLVEHRLRPYTYSEYLNALSSNSFTLYLQLAPEVVHATEESLLSFGKLKMHKIRGFIIKTEIYYVAQLYVTSFTEYKFSVASVDGKEYGKPSNKALGIRRRTKGNINPKPARILNKNDKKLIAEPNSFGDPDHVLKTPPATGGRCAVSMCTCDLNRPTSKSSKPMFPRSYIEDTCPRVLLNITASPNSVLSLTAYEKDDCGDFHRIPKGHFLSNSNEVELIAKNVDPFEKCMPQPVKIVANTEPDVKINAETVDIPVKTLINQSSTFKRCINLHGTIIVVESKPAPLEHNYHDKVPVRERTKNSDLVPLENYNEEYSTYLQNAKFNRVKAGSNKIPKSDTEDPKSSKVISLNAKYNYTNPDPFSFDKRKTTIGNKGPTAKQLQNLPDLDKSYLKKENTKESFQSTTSSTKMSNLPNQRRVQFSTENRIPRHKKLSDVENVSFSKDSNLCVQNELQMNRPALPRRRRRYYTRNANRLKAQPHVFESSSSGSDSDYDVPKRKEKEVVIKEYAEKPLEQTRVNLVEDKYSRGFYKLIRYHSEEESFCGKSPDVKMKKDVKLNTEVKPKISFMYPEKVSFKNKLPRLRCSDCNIAAPSKTCNFVDNVDCFNAPLKSKFASNIYNAHGKQILNIVGCKIYDNFGIPKKGRHGKEISNTFRIRLRIALKYVKIPNPENLVRNINFERDLLNLMTNNPDLKTDLHCRVYDVYGRPLFDRYGYLQYDSEGSPLTDAYNRSLYDSYGKSLISPLLHNLAKIQTTSSKYNKSITQGNFRKKPLSKSKIEILEKSNNKSERETALQTPQTEDTFLKSGEKIDSEETGLLSSNLFTQVNGEQVSSIENTYFAVHKVMQV